MVFQALTADHHSFQVLNKFPLLVPLYCSSHGPNREYGKQKQISQFLTFRMFVLVFWAEVLVLDGGGRGRIRALLLNFLLLLELRFYLRSFSRTPSERGRPLRSL